MSLTMSAFAADRLQAACMRICTHAGKSGGAWHACMHLLSHSDLCREWDKVNEQVGLFNWYSTSWTSIDPKIQTTCC